MPLPLASSFRDPAGYMFSENGVYKRIVTMLGKPDYDLLLSSGLYKEPLRAGIGQRTDQHCIEGAEQSQRRRSRVS